MLEEDFEEYCNMQPIPVVLPKFEKRLKNLKGIYIDHSTVPFIKATLIQDDKTTPKKRGQPRLVTVNPYKDLDLCPDILSDVLQGVTSTFTSGTGKHKSDLLPSVLRRALYDLSECSTAGFRPYAGVSLRQAQKYNKAFNLCVLFLDRCDQDLLIVEMEEVPDGT